MRADADGRPALGPTARTLGVRPGPVGGVLGDVLVDAEGMVEPGAGGMSVSPDDPANLPEHRRPPALGGSGKDPVFGIGADALGSDLSYRPDPDDPGVHGFVEPGRRMRLEDYQEAVAATRGAWWRASD